MRRLVILGAGGHGRVVADIAEQLGWGEIVFLDPNWESLQCSGIWPVIESDRAEVLLNQPDYSEFVVGVGDNSQRAFLQNRLEDLGLPVATLVHPNAVVSRHANIAQGSVISAGAVVNVGSKIERGCIVNTNACVDHDCTIGPFCHVAPGAQLAADVTLRERVFVGLGASVRNGTTILSDAVVGAGAAVVTTVEQKQVVVGTPARPLSRVAR
ncbi:acetyltransferase [uncultured Ruegeria sp.]|uniref:acetyltransferase n=1 Tax=uncultured Ruegeria sp. TaxID=259304 RepID=UPI0026089922|nr:acetyltransferase [uncultured Ruegeria sp.]